MNKMTIEDLIWVLKLKMGEVAEYTVDKENKLGFESDLQMQVIELYQCVQFLEMKAFEMNLYIKVFLDDSGQQTNLFKKWNEDPESDFFNVSERFNSVSGWIARFF